MEKETPPPSAFATDPEDEVAAEEYEPSEEEEAEESENTEPMPDETSYAYWHAIRDSGTTGPEYQQFASPRLTTEERQEIWQLCLRRFYPRLGSLPAEPVLLYWRLGQGRGNWAVTRATANNLPNGRMIMAFDTLLFTAEEFDKFDANPFALLISGAFDLVERNGISNGQSLLPLSARELRDVVMNTDGSTPLPNLTRGHHEEYRDRSLGTLRQWFSWLGKSERKQTTFASWWSTASLEPTPPRDLFTITFTDRKSAVSPENLNERARITASEMSRIIALLPMEYCVRYPALGFAVGELGNAVNCLQLTQGLPAGWQGEDTWSLKRKAYVALRTAQTHLDTFLKARGERGELERVQEDLRALALAVSEDLRNAPPPSLAGSPTTPMGGGSPSSHPAPPVPANTPPVSAPASVPSSLMPSPVASAAATAPERKSGLLGGGGPAVTDESKPRRLGQNYPKNVDAAPRPASSWHVPAIALGVLAFAGGAVYAFFPQWLGLSSRADAVPVTGGGKASARTANAGKAGAKPAGAHKGGPVANATIEQVSKPAPTVPPFVGVKSAETTPTSTPSYTIGLNTTGPIWTGVITAPSPTEAEHLLKLGPGARIQTYDDLNAKVFLIIGAKPLIQGNAAKFGVIYRVNPDTPSPAPGRDVKILSLSGDPITTGIARRPADKATERIAKQAALYLARGFKPADLVGFDAAVVTQAQQWYEEEKAKAGGATKSVAQNK